MANGMASLFVGASGLKSAQTALNTTAHNLSNINTEGYTRQQIAFRDTHYLRIGGSYASPSASVYGLGVGISEIRRIRDEFIDKAYRTENGRLGYYSNQYKAIEEVEDQFGELQGVTFQDALNNLYTAINELSKEPASTVKRSSLIQNASALVTRSDAIYSGLKDYQETLNIDVANAINKINAYGEKIFSLNKQIAKINKITKNYDKTSMVIGEAPLMKDLEDVTNIDIQNVNIASIAAIFVIILIIFKSISLPVILVAIIEFAIAVNMAVPYYQGVSLPFVASIVIGTIQLGATVDYAIVYTNRYLKERRNGKNKLEAISIAHKSNMLSIITSALSLFAATYGVACYSQVDMIGSICTLLARGAIISMIVVLTLLPTMFLIFDKAICKTTKGMGHIDDHKDTVVNDIVL